MKKLVTAAIVVTLSVAATSAMAAGISGTKHDLSTQTGGSNQLCKYCHTPHNAAPAVPLWNRTAASNSGYTFYSSVTMKAVKRTGGAFETGSTSLMCMSCHNGTDTIAAGVINKGNEAMTGITGGSLGITADVIPGASKANLGKAMGNDHPVNIQMTGSMSTGLYDPAASGTKTSGTSLTTPLPLFAGTTAGNGYVECASCHAVHDNTHLKFLRTSNKGSVLCLACHNK